MRAVTIVGVEVAVYAPRTAHFRFYSATTLSHRDVAKR
jgi:hypothetical protein